jgi:organic hydroperoxide reductase OsmC/OhrA
LTAHQYSLRVTWTGDAGSGTSDYRSYERAHEITVPGKPVIAGSSDPDFRGDPTRHNPEELLVASLSSCHMLWYLHLAANVGIVVTGYVDDATGTMRETPDGGGSFSEVTLRPTVTVRGRANPVVAAELHHRAHALCFIANSVNFPVLCEPRLEIEDPSSVSR